MLGEKVEQHLEEQIKEDVAEVGAENCGDEEEEGKLLEEMKKDLAANKAGLEATPAAEKEWK